MCRFKQLFQRLRSRRSPSTPTQVAIAEQPGPARTQLPAPQPAATPMAPATGATLSIALQNQTTSSTVYAYITGQALDRGNAWFLLSADGRTPYYPSSPASVGSPIQQNCAIALGAPGNTVTVTIPHIAGGRIWFSIDTPLIFLLNPGPALVEPSVTNTSDPNVNNNWGFAEFTFNSDQLYAN